MVREQLEALRRQVEEDYDLDIAAIERLQRRYPGASSSIADSTPRNSVPLSAYSSPSKWEEVESRIESPSPVSPPFASAEPRRDELEASLQTMFRAGRK